MKRISAICIAALMVGGCATNSDESLASCGADAFQPLVGQDLSEVADQFPDTARILEPNSLATTDYRVERLNVGVGADGRIIRLSCG